MEINFIANEIVYEVTEYNSYLVGFADDKNEPKEYVIVERALEFDEQDIKLGMDSYYFEYSDQSNSGYGLCVFGVVWVCTKTAYSSECFLVKEPKKIPLRL